MNGEIYHYYVIHTNEMKDTYNMIDIHNYVILLLNLI